MKVRELENQLAEDRKAAKSDSSSKYFKPPLAPIRERRQPLSRIMTNTRIPPGSSNRRNTIAATTFRSFGVGGSSNSNKENMFGTSNTKERTTAVSKARRISLSPVVRSIPIQPKRRASIAILPSDSENRSTNISNIPSSSTSQLSKLRMMPRRSLSVANFNRAPKTPEDSVAGSKFSSPVMKSRIPTRIASSPSMNKLCFSVQKRVSIGLPAPATIQQLRFGNQQSNNGSGSSILGGLAALGNRGWVGRLGTVQRGVMTKKRRQSVI